MASIAIVKAQNDPSYGGLFSTSKPYVDPDEYVQPENKQDQFDWKLTKVSEHFFCRFMNVMDGVMLKNKLLTVCSLQEVIVKFNINFGNFL